MPSTLHEPARDLPLANASNADTDVIVAGAGPAGVAAALAAARTGARTTLIEAHGCLGGVWTTGLLSWIIDAANKPGIMREITHTLDQRGARIPRVQGGANYAYDPEQMKLLLEELVLEAGIHVRLHTQVVAARVDPDTRRLTHLVTESKTGREAWTARCFVDATGDGDLAARAGCGYDLGHPDTGECQPMSLIALVTGIHARDIPDFIGGSLREPKERLFAEFRRAGIEPSYAAPILFRIRDDFFAFIGNHEYGASALDAGQITTATLRARAEIHRLAAALRTLGHPWQNLRVITTAAQIGIREARRIHGLHTVTAAELVNGARHDDAICRATFGIDVHSTNPNGEKSYDPVNRTRTQPYDIPLRALIARDVDGLLLAGRCISGDFLAHASYRVTGNAAALGQAAGVAAALAARTGSLPQSLPWPEVRAALNRIEQLQPVTA
ncbi:FAD-dependent oxidoreductase [Geminisphaera colitermitum]|uniref:FAD-dependent oxidoreductase n=1 Tax=Geminisphaera colitermitum TaxID=1148786 RepID=UPI000158C53E|nr:FAD-dependent oxidoreductase [Geminisphaera colitermitum]